MKHSAPQTAKFKKLIRLLRPSLSNLEISLDVVAVGILERLWHATILNAPQGDIGKVDDETLCELIGWHLSPELLINALLEAGWLDYCQEHRLIVHDWSEHCPSFVKGTLKAAKREFLFAKPNLTEPDVTKPNLTGKVQAKGKAKACPKDGPKEPPKDSPKDADKSADLFESFWAAYPTGRKTGKQSARKSFSKASKTTDPKVIIDAAAEYASSDVGQGEFVKAPTTWLNGGCWEDDRAAWTNKSKQVKSHGQRALEEQW